MLLLGSGAPAGAAPNSSASCAAFGSQTLAQNGLLGEARKQLAASGSGAVGEALRELAAVCPH